MTGGGAYRDGRSPARALAEARAIIVTAAKSRTSFIV
jgi:hypothetical protein